MDCRARRMTKKLESPIRCGQRGVIITCNSAFAGLQQLTYRLGSCALPLIHGHRSAFRSANDHNFFVSRMDAVASEGVRTMLRKTMIVLATVAALTGGLTVDALRTGAVVVAEVTGAVLVAAEVTVAASVAAISVAPK